MIFGNNRLYWVFKQFLRSQWANGLDVNRLMLFKIWKILKLKHVLFPADFGSTFGFVSPNIMLFKALESKHAEIPYGSALWDDFYMNVCSMCECMLCIVYVTAWIFIHVCRWLMRLVVRSKNYSYHVECMIDYG